MIESVATLAHTGNPTTTPSATLPATQAGDIVVVILTNGGSNTPGLGELGGTSGQTWEVGPSLGGPFGGSAMNGSMWWCRATGNLAGLTVTGKGLTNSSALVGAVYRGCVAVGSPFRTHVAFPSVEQNIPYGWGEFGEGEVNVEEGDHLILGAALDTAVEGSYCYCVLAGYEFPLQVTARSVAGAGAGASLWDLSAKERAPTDLWSYAEVEYTGETRSVLIAAVLMAAEEGPKTVEGNAAGTGQGSGTAKGKRSRKGKAAGSGTGSGSASGTVIHPDRPNRLRVNEGPPMRQYLLATTPSGRCYRWGEDGPGAEDVLADLKDSDSVPGGCKEMTGSLPRRAGVDYSDMKPGTRVEVFGAGQSRGGEYRIERAPRSTGDRLVMDPAAVGYETHLIDNESVQEIFIDADMGAWGSPSARYMALEFIKTWKINSNASVQLLAAGTPDPENPSSWTRVPAISHSWAELNITAGAIDAAQNWYDSGGVELGRVLLDFLNVKGGSGGNWVNSLIAAADDVATGGEELKNFNATTALQQSFSIAPGRFFLILHSFLNQVFEGKASWEDQWRNIRVLGRHGLPLHGTWPGVGVLASDVVAYSLARWAPLINFTTGTNGTIRPTQFPISQLAFKETTTVAEVIKQATRFELPEWGVWPGPKGPTFHMNPRGQREGAKRWRVRAREAQLEDTGQQMDRVWNGVAVGASDTGGRSLLIGPPGSGLRVTDARLLDSDPLNPANEIPGLKRYAKIQLKDPATIEGMVEAGEAFLEQTKLLDGSGRATLTSYVEDEHGVLWPYYCVHAGDEIEVLGSSVAGYRYIVNAARSRSSRSVSIDIDAPPDSYEALMERLNAEFVGVGMG